MLPWHNTDCLLSYLNSDLAAICSILRERCIGPVASWMADCSCLHSPSRTAGMCSLVTSSVVSNDMSASSMYLSIEQKGRIQLTG